MSQRSHISFKTKLASALCNMLREEDGKFVPIIPYEHAKKMTADEVLSLFQFDHYPVRKVDGGPDEHYNLVPRLIPEHRAKTAKVDQPEIAKGRRRVEISADIQRILLKPCGHKRAPSSRWPKRPFKRAERDR